MKTGAKRALPDVVTFVETAASSTAVETRETLKKPIIYTFNKLLRYLPFFHIIIFKFREEFLGKF